VGERWCKPPLVQWQLLTSIGNPGCGKTILAASAIEEIGTWHDHNQLDKPKVCYFFYTQRSAPQKTHQIDAYRSILAQLILRCDSDQRLLDVCTYVMPKPNDSVGQKLASSKELIDLLKLVCE
jgi:hypothetical protein